MALKEYEHAKLDHPELEIRLIKLPPGKPMGQIECSVDNFPLADAPPYEAASYCWGDAHDTVRIICNGCLLTIPRNLNALLLRTRAKGNERMIWADSVCINQKDEDEKGHQIKLMGAIYRRAIRTLAWLGAEDETTAGGLAFAGELYGYMLDVINRPDEDKEEWRVFMSRQPGGAPRKSILSRFPPYQKLSAVFGRKWKALYSMLDREYWRRAWIVQELVLANQAWVICGETALPLPAFFGALMYADTHQRWILEFYGTANNVTQEMRLSWTEIKNGTQRSHLEILARHRRTRASEAKDKIHAFIDLSGHKSFSELELPAYERSTHELYTKLAISTLKRATNLDLLSMPRLPGENPSVGHLPSWVPDWSISPSRYFSLPLLEFQPTIKQGEHYIPYSASGSSALDITIDAPRLRLGLKGYIIDTITELTLQAWDIEDHSAPQTIYKQALTLQKNQSQIHAWESILRPFSTTPYPTNESALDVAYQVCAAGSPLSPLSTTLHLAHRFEQRQRYLRLLRCYNLHTYISVWVVIVLLEHCIRLFGYRNPEMEYRTQVPCMPGRKACRTERGLVAMVPGMAEVGDRVVLVQGGRCPLVLRRVNKTMMGLKQTEEEENEEDGEEDGEWELIGDAYLHGIMFGGAWDEEREMRRMWIV
jgi:hypothetical protein